MIDLALSPEDEQTRNQIMKRCFLGLQYANPPFYQPPAVQSPKGEAR